MGILSEEASSLRGDAALTQWRSAMDVLRELQLQYKLAKNNRDASTFDLKTELDAVSLACDLMLADAVVAQRKNKV